MNNYFDKIICSIAVLLMLMFTAINSSAQVEDSLYLSVDSTRDSFCNQPEARQFDFWLGSWNLAWGEGSNAGTGTNTVTPELGECMIQENFKATGLDPFIGRSISVFDTKTNHWKQTWTDNRGGYLDFTGGWKTDRMILSREVTTDSLQYLQRMVWFDITKNSLEWNWQRSDNNGKTWHTLWHISYTRK